MSMTKEEAARALAGDSTENPPEPSPASEADSVEIPERTPPLRKFVWLDDSAVSVEEWLAGQAHAVIQVVPGLTVQFSEAKESARDEVDALVNGRGPAFIMKGMRDGVMATQVRRATNIGLLAVSITHMNGERWMPGVSLDERWKALKDKGTLMIDRLTAALYEFTDVLLHEIESADLGNS